MAHSNFPPAKSDVTPLPMVQAVELVRTRLLQAAEDLTATSNALERVGLTKPAEEIHHAVQEILTHSQLLVVSYSKHLDEIAEHLEDEHVCVILEIGAEKKRYITGFGWAVHSTGEQIRVALNDIYDAAVKAFPSARPITPAEY